MRLIKIEDVPAPRVLLPRAAEFIGTGALEGYCQSRLVELAEKDALYLSKLFAWLDAGELAACARVLQGHRINSGGRMEQAEPPPPVLANYPVKIEALPGKPALTYKGRHRFAGWRVCLASIGKRPRRHLEFPI